MKTEHLPVLPVIVCIVVPLFVLGIIAFMRSQYEVFGLGFPPQDLHREDDHRLLNLRLTRKPGEFDPHDEV